MQADKKRIGIFGWGIVAPKSPDVHTFERNLLAAESWLGSFDGFGPNNFLVGKQFALTTPAAGQVQKDLAVFFLIETP